MTDRAAAATRVLGIDPGLHRTGYACVELLDGEAEPALVEAGVLRLRSDASLAFRLRQLHEDIVGLLDELQPACMTVESLFVHREYARTAILMGHARGVVLLAGESRGVRIDEIPPASVKKAMTGRGRATKLQVQLAVMGQCGLSLPPSPSDVADAIAIALTGARRIASRLGE
ncbi:MAG: crossover junction endodeoxyribonuclease RuvC [Phycisphaerales bacterium]